MKCRVSLSNGVVVDPFEFFESMGGSWSDVDGVSFFHTASFFQGDGCRLFIGGFFLGLCLLVEKKYINDGRIRLVSIG